MSFKDARWTLSCGKCGRGLRDLDHVCPPPGWQDPIWNPPETAGNGPSGDDRPSGGYGEGSAAEIAARARAEAFEECARIAEGRCADFVERLAALLETGGNSVEMQSRASESAKIAAEIRRRAKP